MDSMPCCRQIIPMMMPEMSMVMSVMRVARSGEQQGYIHPVSASPADDPQMLQKDLCAQNDQNDATGSLSFLFEPAAERIADLYTRG